MVLGCPVQSCVDVTFWSELAKRKLDTYKLSEVPIDINGNGPVPAATSLMNITPAGI